MLTNKEIVHTKLLRDVNMKDLGETNSNYQIMFIGFSLNQKPIKLLVVVIVVEIAL